MSCVCKIRGTSVKRIPVDCGPESSLPRTIAAAVVLVSAVVIVYHNALSAYFFDDDFQWLVGSWSFTPSQLVAFGTLNHFYRPVIDLYFAAATPLFHGSPVLFHLASIVLHAANAIVIFALAREL